MIFPVCHWSSSGFAPYTITIEADDTWVAPFSGNVSVECWGAGAPGEDTGSFVHGGGGGGGGGYARINSYAVTSGDNYTVVVNTDATGNTYFVDAGTVMAVPGLIGGGVTGGVGGLGGSSASCVGDVVYSGGNGGDGSSTQGGGGGGSPTSSANGGNGGTPTAGTGEGPGGAGGTGGGAGGAGVAPGGGGGGQGQIDGGGGGGGAGTAGRIKITRIS